MPEVSDAWRYVVTVENVIESEVMPLRRGTSGYRTVTVALFAAGLSTFISMYAAQALLPAFAEDFHVSPAVSALSVSATTGMLALAIIPASALSERFGRTRVMIASASASCVIGLLLPLSPTIEVLLVGRAAQGLALAGVPAVAMAYLAEEVDRKNLGAAMEGTSPAQRSVADRTARAVGRRRFQYVALGAVDCVRAVGIVRAQHDPAASRVEVLSPATDIGAHDRVESTTPPCEPVAANTLRFGIHPDGRLRVDLQLPRVSAHSSAFRPS